MPTLATASLGLKLWHSGECCLYLPFSASPCGPQRLPRSGGGRRGLAGCSRHSRRRLRRWVENSVVRPYALFTCTYPAEFPAPRAGKVHLRALLRLLLAAGMHTVTWVMEFQRRGAVHFHLLLDRFLDFSVAAELWRRATRGLANESAGTEVRKVRDVSKTSRYLAKYLSKNESKQGFTGAGRCWGRVGDVRESPVEAVAFVGPGESVPAAVQEVAKLMVCPFFLEHGGVWGYVAGGLRHVVLVVGACGLALVGRDESLAGYMYRMRPSRRLGRGRAAALE